MAELVTFFIILIAGLIFSELFKRLHLPYVTALIVAGVVIGPFALNIVGINPILEFFASIGIVFLMFIALHFAIKISSLSDQVKNLAQKLSLIEAEREREK